MTRGRLEIKKTSVCTSVQARKIKIKSRPAYAPVKGGGSTFQWQTDKWEKFLFCLIRLRFNDRNKAPMKGGGSVIHVLTLFNDINGILSKTLLNVSLISTRLFNHQCGLLLILNVRETKLKLVS